MTELDALDPVPETLTLSTGTVVVIEDLRTRQFFKLLRIITRGAMPALADLSLFQMDSEEDAKAFASKLAGMLLVSLPEAENEAIDFIQSMVKPAGLVERRGARLNKQETERNTELWAKVLTDLDNPELDDLVTLIEVVVRREAADIMALGKRLAAMLKLAQKTGQLSKESPQNNPTTPAVNFSEVSVGHLTYSPTSTGGDTTTSRTFHYAGSDSVSQQSASVASGPNAIVTNG